MTKETEPLLTVLMPVYNGASFLQAAIDSILNQSFSKFELLIINDASKDDSSNIIKLNADPRIRYIENHKNLGLIGTLNKGLELASCDLIARMDQDDLANAERLAKQYKLFQENKALVAAGTAIDLISESGANVGFVPAYTGDQQIKRALSVVCPFVHPTMMFKKSAVLQVGGYSESAYAAEDYDLWSRLATVGELTNLDEPLLRYRLNPQGMSISLREKQKKITCIIADRCWDQFGSIGPAPIEQWSQIWPEKQSKLSAEQKQLHSRLHQLFAQGYRRRGMWAISIKHLLAAFQWNLLGKGNYLALIMYVLPFQWFEKLHEKAANYLNNIRAHKVS